MSITHEDDASRTAPEFLSGGGEMGGRIRAVAWSQTPLGPVEGWPAALASTLGVCLSARFPMAIYWGPESILLYNDAWRPILGDKHPWALGRTAREVWPEIWDAIAPLLASVLKTGEATWREDELLAMQRFGYTEECYFDYSFNPIWGQSGGVEGILNVVQETTYRLLNDRRARLLRELAARSASAKSEMGTCAAAVSAMATDPADIPFALLYLVEPGGRRARLIEATGLPGESPARTDAIDLSAETVRKGWPLADAFRSGSDVTVDDLAERFGTMPGGFWPEPVTQALVLPVDAAGSEGAAALLVAGVNPRHRLDDDYRHFFGLVASHVATALNNARAYEEEKRRAEALAEIDRAKTLFFSNVSHELRTPLTLMLSPLEETLARNDGGLPPADREQLSLVHRNGLRLLKLVNTLLDFSRIEAGRAQAVYEPVDLAAYTAELASVFRSAVERAGLRLVVNCPPLPEPVYVDREMWEKVVLNLVSNAFKFTLEGEIEVSLRETDGRVELHVRDTGTGIPPEEIDHVFERFHRVKGSRGRTHEGTGIGLALVQELVKLHGGSVTVSSMYGRGTTFTVSLPKGTAHLPQDRIEGARTMASTSVGATPFIEEALRWLPSDAAGAETATGDLSLDSPGGDGHPSKRATDGARVLLADDNADMRGYVQRLLERHYEVETVSDGQAALAAARARVPDLVLTDVMMPRLDGFGLLRELRSDAHTRTVPVIMLSARAGEESRVEGLEAGADDYLVKPFSARELLARVRANLEMARLRREFTRQLEAAHARNEEILASISDAFFVYDHEWRYVYVNDKACEMARHPREELIGKIVWEVFPDAVGTEAHVEARRVAATGQPVSFENYYAPFDQWFENRIYPSAEGVTVFVTDITERKRAEGLTAADLLAMTRLHQLGARSVQPGVGFDAVLGEIVEAAIAITGADKGNIQLFDETENALRLAAHRGFAEPFLEFFARVGRGESAACGSALQAGGRVVVEDVTRSEIFVGTPALDVLRGEGVRAVQSTPLVSSGGHVLGMISTHFGRPHRLSVRESRLMDLLARQAADFIERRKAEEALRESEQRFRALVTASSDVVYRMSADWAEMRHLQGRDFMSNMEEASRTWMEKYIHTDDQPRVLAAINEAIRTRSTYELEHRVIRVDGTLGWTFSRAIPLLNAQGEIVEWFGAASDVTERRLAEEALREQTEVVETINRVGQTLSAELDLHKVVQAVTDAATELTGARFGSFFYNVLNEQGKSYMLYTLSGVPAEAFAHFPMPRNTDLFAPTFMGEGTVRIADVKLDPRYGKNSPYYGMPDGHLPVTSYLAVPVVSRSGEVLGGLFFGHPEAGAFTERDGRIVEGLAAQAAIAMDNARLYEAAQRERTHAERLYQEADRANRLKDEFLATVSHELRTPLTAIIGWTHLLRTGQLDEAGAARALETVERNARSQNQLVEDLLDVSRVITGKLRLDIRPCDPSSFIEAAVEAVRPAAEAKGVRLQKTFDTGVGAISGDAERLQQVVWNLLSNAIKFTPRGGRVHVRLERVNSHVEIVVTDTGAGIPEEFLPHVFDRFRQADMGSTRRHGGLGLGLSIVRHLVEMHGGTVEADSHGEGQGATFTVKLPLIPVYHREAAQERVHPRVSGDLVAPVEYPDRLDGLKVLVVDDETDTYELLGMLLTRSGAEVVTARSAEDALAELGRSRFDLLVSDIGMPGVDGYELIRRVRELPAARGGQIPAIALTAYARAEDRVRALRGGFQTHVAKPVEPAELIAVAASLTGRTKKE